MTRMARLTVRVALVVLTGHLWLGAATAAAGGFATSDVLAALSGAQRANARIELEPAGEEPAGLLQRLAAIADQWNQGRCEDALPAVRALEAGGVELALALSWREPVAAEPKAQPVMVGTRTGTAHLVLDSHAATGKLFVVAQDDDGSHVYWRVYMSTNGGASWVETAQYSGSSIPDSAAVVVADYLYISYLTATGTALRVRRCTVADGLMDTGYGYATPYTTTGTFTETAIISPADFDNQRLYVLAIESGGTLRYAWDDQTAGSWEEITTVVTTAAHSLDACTRQTQAGIELLASYVATDGGIRVWRRGQGGETTVNLGITWLDAPGSTVSISAWKTQAIVAYLAQPPSFPTMVCVVGSYDGGASWPGGECFTEGDYDLVNPAVTLRGGAGAALVAQVDIYGGDYLYMTHASAGSNTDWSEPERAADVNLVLGADSTVEHLAGGGWGVLVTHGTDSQVYYATAPLLLHDGFENGGTTSWSGVAP